MSTLYTNGVRRLLNTTNWTDETYRAALVSDSINYSPTPFIEAVVDDVLNGSTAAEFSGSGYSRQTLSIIGVDDVSSSNDVELRLDDQNFGVLDGDTIEGVLIFEDIGGDDSQNLLVSYLDGGDLPYTTDGTEDITINFSSAGTFTV
jgi:hypothetical protein